MRRTLWTILVTLIAIPLGCAAALSCRFGVRLTDRLIAGETPYAQYLAAETPAGLLYVIPYQPSVFSFDRVSDYVPVSDRSFGAYDDTTSPAGGPIRAMWIPYWFAYLAIGGLPAVWLLQTLIGGWLRGRRAVDSHCGECGYDLTGNVTGRCPECGDTIPGFEGAIRRSNRRGGLTSHWLRRWIRTGSFHAGIVVLLVSVLWWASGIPGRMWPAGTCFIMLTDGAMLIHCDADNPTNGRDQLEWRQLQAKVQRTDRLRLIIPVYRSAGGETSLVFPMWIPLVVAVVIALETWYRGRLRFAPRRMAPATAIDASTRPGVQP